MKALTRIGFGFAAALLLAALVYAADIKVDLSREQPGKPPVPARADGKLRVADINPNEAGVAAITQALGIAVKPSLELATAIGSVRAVVMLGDVSATASIRSVLCSAVSKTISVSPSRMRSPVRSG